MLRHPSMEALEHAHLCDLHRLPGELAGSFVELTFHEESHRWVESAVKRPHGTCTSFFARAARAVLSDYDVNGLFGLHDMHLLPTAQWAELLGPAAGGRLLDIGAGDGTVTTTLAPLFREVLTTELSWPMARRLRRQGFSVLAIDATHEEVPGAPFDVVALLNVLDRTLMPQSLLERARHLVRPEGHLLLSLPLPYSPHVHRRNQTVDPEEVLPIEGRDWEESVIHLVERVLSPLRLSVHALARAPYLSRGDRQTRLHRLDDVIALCAMG